MQPFNNYVHINQTIAVNDSKSILIEIKYVLHLMLPWMAAILHSVVSLCQLFYSGVDKLQWTSHLSPQDDLLYNLCEAMLITLVARPLCLCPRVDRRTDRQPFIGPGDGEQLWGETNPAVRPASVTERPHERCWQHSFRPGLGQQEYVCVCVWVCVCASQLILWLFVKTGSYD